MSRSSSKSTGHGDRSLDRVVCRNRRAHHDFEILDEIECGVALRGSEVKSIRNNKISIDEAYASVENGEVWLHNVDIAEYPQATLMNHERRRVRKLLLKRREIQKFAESAEQDGQTLIPLDVHFRRGNVKILLAVGKGRKLHDKREKLKSQAAGREMRDAVRRAKG